MVQDSSHQHHTPGTDKWQPSRPLSAVSQWFLHSPVLSHFCLRYEDATHSNQGQRASPTCTLSFCPVLHVVLCLQLHGAHAITCYVPLVSDVSKAVPGGLKPHDVPSLPTQTAELRSGLRIPDKSVAFIPGMWECSTPRKGLRLGVWSRTVDRTGPLVQM